MLDVAVVDPVKNFWIQAGVRADDQDLGISVEKVQNPTGGDLANKLVSYRKSSTAELVGMLCHTSPPPTTSTFLPLIRHARIREPPPWTFGNFSDMVRAQE